MMRALIETAVEAGARRGAACQLLGLSVRTVERWRAAPDEDDARHGPHDQPANALTPVERRTILAVVTSAAYCDVSPHQIVPRLADTGRYLASESTMYRILLARRHCSSTVAAPRRPSASRRRTHVATGPHQLWSWDLTDLETPVRGVFDYLYLRLDVWSRKIVGWAVQDVESAEHAAALFRATCAAQQVDPRGLVLHADNGGPMKGATMVATLERLGVLASYSRPSVSNDNAYSESLFRTLKYCPAIRRSRLRIAPRRGRGSRPSCAGTTRSICTAPFGSSRPTTGTRDVILHCCSRAVPSISARAVARPHAGAEPCAIGNPSTPCD